MSCVDLKRIPEPFRPFIEDGIQVDMSVRDASGKQNDAHAFDALVDTGSVITALPGEKIELKTYADVVGQAWTQDQIAQLARQVKAERKVPVRLRLKDLTSGYGLLPLARPGDEIDTGKDVERNGDEGRKGMSVRILARIRVSALGIRETEELEVLVWPELLESVYKQQFVYAIIGADLLFRIARPNGPGICVCRKAIRIGRSCWRRRWRAISSALSRLCRGKRPGGSLAV